MDEVETLAFRKWHQHYVPSDVDSKFKRSDSLMACRKGLLLTLKTVADKLGMAVPSYHKLEWRERYGGITIRDLREAAEAMDCDLIYYIRPKSRQTFAKIIWEKLKARAELCERVIEARKYEPTWAARVLAARAIRLFRDKDFRKEMGWSRLKTTRNNHKYKRTKPIKNWAMPEPRPSRRNRGR